MIPLLSGSRDCLLACSPLLAHHRLPGLTSLVSGSHPCLPSGQRACNPSRSRPFFAHSPPSCGSDPARGKTHISPWDHQPPPDPLSLPTSPPPLPPSPCHQSVPSTLASELFLKGSCLFPPQDLCTGCARCWECPSPHVHMAASSPPSNPSSDVPSSGRPYPSESSPGTCHLLPC